MTKLFPSQTKKPKKKKKKKTTTMKIDTSTTAAETTTAADTTTPEVTTAAADTTVEETTAGAETTTVAGELPCLNTTCPKYECKKDDGRTIPPLFNVNNTHLAGIDYMYTLICFFKLKLEEISTLGHIFSFPIR
jgi:hypothetical protein